MKKAILPVLLLTSGLLPSLAKAELRMYSTFDQDGHQVEARSLKNFTVQYPDKNYYGDGKADDQTLKLIDHRGRAVRRYRIYLQTPKEARALSEMISEGKVSCLPLFRDGGLADLRGNEEVNFSISSALGKACSASDLMARVNARVETDTFFDIVGALQRGVKSAGSAAAGRITQVTDALMKSPAEQNNDRVIAGFTACARDSACQKHLRVSGAAQ